MHACRYGSGSGGDHTQIFPHHVMKNRLDLEALYRRFAKSRPVLLGSCTILLHLKNDDYRNHFFLVIWQVLPLVPNRAHL